MRLGIANALLVLIFTLLTVGTTPGLGQASEPGDRYVLGQSDRLRITVFDEPDLSGEFEIDEGGNISMPLIGEVGLGGLNLRDGERLIEDRLRDGYLKKPRVNLQVLNFRPFYILGEVKNPGEYEYVSRMTILTAVALAGGFTYRANKEEFLIIRSTDPKREEVEVPVDTVVLPGDVLKVKERFF